MENEVFRMLDNKAIFTALMVVDYYPKKYSGIMKSEEGLEEAYVKVYNSLLEELIQRGVLKC